MAVFDQSRHAGQAIGTAAADGAHRHRFGLIVGVMSHEEMKEPALPARLEQQAIPRSACSFLKAAHRLGTGPAKNVGRDVVTDQKIARSRGLGRGLGAQAMIHDQSDDMAAARQSPFAGQKREHQGISATRDSNGNDRLALEWREGRHQGRERLRRQLHPLR